MLWTASIELFRLIFLALTVCVVLFVSGLVLFHVDPAFIHIALVFSASLLVFITLGFLRELSRVVRANIQAAQRVAAGHYDAAFSHAKGTGLISQGQCALQGMLDHFKRELSLTKGVMRSMITPYVVTDTNEIFISGNQALIEMLEHDGKCEDYYGQDVSVFFYGEKRQTVLGIAMRENRSISKEVEFTGRKGGKRNIHIDAAPLYDIENKLMGALCIYTDLSAIRASEAKLCAQNEIISTAANKAMSISKAMATAAEEMASQVEQASRGTEEQRARITETATAMEQMNATVLEVAKNASQAAEASDQAKSKAIEGAKVVSESVAAINMVQKQSSDMRKNLGELGRQAEQIGRIMNVIEDIADQTNLLALNAAIEAARAGDAGRGFAVVADEVRKLAEKTMNATKEVGQAISDIQNSTQSNISGMDQAALSIEEATARANASGTTLQEILALAELAADQVRSIATAAEQQSAASEQIHRGVEQINQISAETSEVMNQSAAAVSKLARMAVELDAIIDEMRAKAPEECAT